MACDTLIRSLATPIAFLSVEPSLECLQRSVSRWIDGLRGRAGDNPEHCAVVICAPRRLQKISPLRSSSRSRPLKLSQYPFPRAIQSRTARAANSVQPSLSQSRQLSRPTQTSWGRKSGHYLSHNIYYGENNIGSMLLWLRL